MNNKMKCLILMLASGFLQSCGGSGTGSEAEIETPIDSLVAVINIDTSTTVDGVIKLNGSGSSSSTGATLSYSWKITNAPMNSVNKELVGNLSTFEFTLDKLGTYVAELTISDGSLSVSTERSLNANFANDAIFNPPADYLVVCSATQIVKSAEYQCSLVDFESYGYGKLSSYIVQKSNTIFRDKEARQKEISSLSKDKVNFWCLSDGLGVDYSNYSAPVALDMAAEKDKLFRMFDTLVYSRAHYLYLGNLDAAKMAYRSLLNWAEARAMLDTELAFNAGPALDLKTISLAFFNVWNDIKDLDFIDTANRTLIEAYLFDLAKKLNYVTGYIEGMDGPAGLDVFNHGWQQDVSLMSYGVMTGDNDLFQRGIRRFFAVLDGIIREDGSHYFESQRGSEALGYSFGATSLLIRLAEIAANQGYNLYDVEINGISLHTIVEFHIAAAEDNQLIHQYTQYQVEGLCTPEQCEKWDQQAVSYEPIGGFFEFSDYEIYRRRFPDSALNLRFDNVFPATRNQALYNGPLLQSCEFRQFE